MCTGDNKDTAVAISKAAGIVTKEEAEGNEYACMTGKEFREEVGEDLIEITVDGKLKKVPENMKKFREIFTYIKVLARSSPLDKLILVTGIQECGGVVAVTGDGTNDAPALRKADVGFAMQSGTQVAHAASDIIIQDDNFASIVKACSWGRNVYDNIRRFLQFQLSVNCVALFSCLIGSLVFQKSPLAAI